MRLNTVAGVLTALVVASATAEPLWDGAVSVPAVADGPKTWLTCPKGQVFKNKSRDTPEQKCFVRGFISDEERGEGKQVSAQELLTTHYLPPADYEAIAVGVLPELAIGANNNYYDKTAVLVAYRLTPRK